MEEEEGEEEEEKKKKQEVEEEGLESSLFNQSTSMILAHYLGNKFLHVTFGSIMWKLESTNMSDHQQYTVRKIQSSE
jgi:hypothetical protein